MKNTFALATIALLIGAAPALTVTYLIPVFGTLWGVVFLGERIGVHHVLGAAMILGGIALVARVRGMRP